MYIHHNNPIQSYIGTYNSEDNVSKLCIFFELNATPNIFVSLFFLHAKIFVSNWQTETVTLINLLVKKPTQSFNHRPTILLETFSHSYFYSQVIVKNEIHTLGDTRIKQLDSNSSLNMEFTSECTN